MNIVDLLIIFSILSLQKIFVLRYCFHFQNLTIVLSNRHHHLIFCLLLTFLNHYVDWLALKNYFKIKLVSQIYLYSIIIWQQKIFKCNFVQIRCQLHLLSLLSILMLTNQLYDDLYYSNSIAQFFINIQFSIFLLFVSSFLQYADKLIYVLIIAKCDTSTVLSEIPLSEN